MHEDKLIKDGELKTLTGNPVKYNYRVWNTINYDSRLDHYAVGSPEEAVFVITDLAFEQIEHDGVKDNNFGLEVRKDGEWVEWTDQDEEFGVGGILELIDLMAEQAMEDLDEFEDLGPEDAIGGWYDD